MSHKLDAKQFDLKHSDESDLAARLRAAIGAGPDEQVTIRTPQFTRPANWPRPGGPPGTREQWDALREMTRDALIEMGLGNWNGRLMLFPGEWYLRIPAGFEVECLMGEVEPFELGVTDDDIRFGFLPYGVPAADGVEEPEEDEVPRG